MLGSMQVNEGREKLYCPQTKIKNNDLYCKFKLCQELGLDEDAYEEDRLRVDQGCMGKNLEELRLDINSRKATCNSNKLEKLPENICLKIEDGKKAETLLSLYYTKYKDVMKGDSCAAGYYNDIPALVLKGDNLLKEKDNKEKNKICDYLFKIKYSKNRLNCEKVKLADLKDHEKKNKICDDLFKKKYFPKSNSNVCRKLTLAQVKRHENNIGNFVR